MRGYLPPQTPEEQLLVRRVQDAAAGVRYGGGYRFLGFLDERGKALAEARLNKEDVCAAFWGGFEGAQRCYMGIGDEAAPLPEDFPLAAVRITCWMPGHTVPAAQLPTHRDYLGALLGLGLRRECIGDILTDGDSAMCFLDEKMARLVLEELTGVGRFSVNTQRVDAAEAAGWRQKTEEVRINVPSLRVDAVLASLLHVSRADAAGLILRGAVSLCHVPLTQQHAAVQEGDTLSVRGYGRWRITETGGLSRKGRIWLNAEKFIG